MDICLLETQSPTKRCLEGHNKTLLDNPASNTHSKNAAPFDKTFTCRFCQAAFDNEGEITNHFQNSHPNSFPFQCSKCMAEFDSESSESKHNCCKINAEVNILCVFCNLKLPTYNDLYFHINKQHTRKDIICQICNKIFANEEALKEHSLTHREGKRFDCIFCSKAYSNSQNLTLHMRRHTNTKLLKCKICFRAFLDNDSLLQHMLFHASLPIIDRAFTCCFCSASFSQRGGLKFHLQQNHIGKEFFTKCPVCNEDQEEERMSNHIISHCSRIYGNNMTKIEKIWSEKNKLYMSQEMSYPATNGNKHQLQNKGYKLRKSLPKSNTNVSTKAIKLEKPSAAKLVARKNTLAEKPKSTKIATRKNKTITKSVVDLNDTNKETISKPSKCHIKQESEEIRFDEDLEFIKKRLEESSDSEFENETPFLGFNVEPSEALPQRDSEILEAKEIQNERKMSRLSTYNSKHVHYEKSKLEKTSNLRPAIVEAKITKKRSNRTLYQKPNEILKAKETKKERTVLSSTHKDKSVCYQIPKSEKTELIKPLKMEETLTKERPMSFLLVMSSNKTTKSPYENVNKGIENNSSETTAAAERNDCGLLQGECKSRITLNQTKLLNSSNKIVFDDKNLDLDDNKNNVMGNEENGLDNEEVESDDKNDDGLENEVLEVDESNENLSDNEDLENDDINENGMDNEDFESDDNNVIDFDREILHDNNEEVLDDKDLELDFNNENSPENKIQVMANKNKHLLCKENLVTDDLEESEKKAKDQITSKEEFKSQKAEESKQTSEENKDAEEDLTNGCIQEKKYFEPNRKLSKYSCTTCVMTFSTQDELFLHNYSHII